MEQRTKKRILVVEDNLDVQNVLSEILYFFGFEVTLVGNGVEALTVFSQNSFDMVLTDLQMPAMDGSSLACHIKERSPETPVILMTGACKGAAWEKAQRATVDSVIFKPFSMADLRQAVQSALDAREGQGSMVAG
jgi:CheY-like chemotaxis protein